MTRTVLCWFSVNVLCVVAANSAIAAEAPFQDLTFQQACEKATKEKKIVLIDFYTTWCGPCKMLDRSTWPDPRVKQLLTDKTVALKVDAEKNRELATKFHINSYPQIVFIKADGTEIDRLSGFRGADQFLKEAEGPISGHTALDAAADVVKRTPNDPIARFQYAEMLARASRPADALKEYLWCFDNGVAAKADFAGLRNSYVIMRIAGLTRSLPAAAEALRQRRDAASARLTAPVPTAGAEKPASQPTTTQPANRRDAAIDIVLIDRALQHPDETTKLYDQLKAQGAGGLSARQALAPQIIDVLWNQKRYTDIMADGGDPTARLTEMMESYQQNRNSGSADARVLDYIKQRTSTLIGMYYEAMLASNDAKAADALARKMIEFDKTDRTFAGLINHAKRVGQIATARQIADEARKALSVGDHRLVDVATSTLAPATTQPAAAQPTSMPAKTNSPKP